MKQGSPSSNKEVSLVNKVFKPYVLCHRLKFENLYGVTRSIIITWSFGHLQVAPTARVMPQQSSLDTIAFKSNVHERKHSIFKFRMTFPKIKESERCLL